MDVNDRQNKEPGINTDSTGSSSMAVWNIGQLGQDSLSKEQVNPIQEPLANKEQLLNDAIKKFQESQYYNYSVFMGELGQIGYCARPIEMSKFSQFVPKLNANEKCMSYAEHRQRKRRENDKNDDDNKSGNGKSNEVNSDFPDEKGGKSGKNKKQKKSDKPQATLNDEKTVVKPTRKKLNYHKSSNPAYRMSSGWSDEEEEPSRNDRFGESFNYNNDRYGNRRGGINNDRGRGCRRGGGRGRGEQWNENRNINNNDQYNSNNNNVTISIENTTENCWSDDESKATINASEDNNNVNNVKVDPIEDWDNPEPIIKSDPLTEPSVTAVPTTTVIVDEVNCDT